MFFDKEMFTQQTGQNFETWVDTLGVDTLGSEVSASSGFQATRVQTLGSEEGLGFRCRGLGFRV